MQCIYTIILLRTQILLYFVEALSNQSNGYCLINKLIHSHLSLLLDMHVCTNKSHESANKSTNLKEAG